MQFSVVLYNIVICSAVHYRIVQCSAGQYSIVLCSKVQCKIVHFTTGKEQKLLKETEEDIFEVEDVKFKCARCLKIVPLEDTFEICEEIGKKMCQFCTMIILST